MCKEIAELDTVKAALGQEFPQQGELVLVRENHSAVMHELKRMQDEPGHVSSWEPKKGLAAMDSQGYGDITNPVVPQAAQLGRMC